VGAEFFRRAHGHGLIVRAIGDVIALCPPLITTAAQVDEIVIRFGRTLDDVAEWISCGHTDGA
jgi:4-aminobutyrate--pyruvate transaminase